MLSEQCRWFRSAFTSVCSSYEVDHLQGCDACRQWADQVTRLQVFGADLPLQDRLHARLFAIPQGGDRPEQVPQIPLPPDLQRRLLAIPGQQHQASQPPPWIVKARYGLAASMLLAFLSVSALGDTLAHQREKARALTRQAEQRVEAAQATARTGLARLEQLAHGRWQQARQAASGSLVHVTDRWGELSGRVEEDLTSLTEATRDLLPSEQKNPLDRLPWSGKSKENNDGQQQSP